MSHRITKKFQSQILFLKRKTYSLLYKELCSSCIHQACRIAGAYLKHSVYRYLCYPRVLNRWCTSQTLCIFVVFKTVKSLVHFLNILSFLCSPWVLICWCISFCSQLISEKRLPSLLLIYFQSSNFLVVLRFFSMFDTALNQEYESKNSIKMI